MSNNKFSFKIALIFSLIVIAVGLYNHNNNPLPHQQRAVDKLLKSDQPISDAIKAYDAEHPF